MQFDVTHKINHISFGDDSDLKQIKAKFGVGVLNPLDNVKKSDTDLKKTYEYYLKVKVYLFSGCSYYLRRY